jgi:hypothetical protein
LILHVNNSKIFSQYYQYPESLNSNCAHRRDPFGFRGVFRCAPVVYR